MVLSMWSKIWLGKLLKYLNCSLLKLLLRRTSCQKLCAVKAHNCHSILMPFKHSSLHFTSCPFQRWQKGPSEWFLPFLTNSDISESETEVELIFILRKPNRCYLLQYSQGYEIKNISLWYGSAILVSLFVPNRHDPFAGNEIDHTEVSVKKFDSTGMFHWCEARDIEKAILVGITAPEISQFSHQHQYVSHIPKKCFVQKLLLNTYSHLSGTPPCKYHPVNEMLFCIASYIKWPGSIYDAVPFSIN